MTYTIGQAWDPEKYNEQSCWSLDINYVSEDEAIRRSHWACIQVHAASLNLCLLKAKLICDMLNQPSMDAAEVMVDKLQTQAGHHVGF